MTAFLEDWHHQGSGPGSRDFASIQGSLKMIWRMEAMILICDQVITIQVSQQLDSLCFIPNYNPLCH